MVTEVELQSKFQSETTDHLKRRKSLERWMLPKCILSIKSRTCNPTPIEHQHMTKKTTFIEKQ